MSWYELVLSIDDIHLYMYNKIGVYTGAYIQGYVADLVYSKYYTGTRSPYRAILSANGAGPLELNQVCISLQYSNL